nr:DegT/DnrJ/EryC1/StrS family aminotransferase [Variovorax sp. E3]
MKSGHVIMGGELVAFENEFAAYCGAKHCIGVGNGLDALALTLRARGIKAGERCSCLRRPSSRHGWVSRWWAQRLSRSRSIRQPTFLIPRASRRS